MSHDRNTPAEPPALYVALRYHASSVAREMRRVGITGGRMSTRWERRDGRVEAILTITLPDGAAPDAMLRARAAARETLICQGFYVGGIATAADAGTIAVTGYYGRAIPAEAA